MKKRLVLADDLRVAQARAAFESLEAAAAKKSVEIDASRVAKIDGAGVQALAAATLRFRAAGVAWKFHEPSEALRRAAHVAGLESVLELP